MVIQNSLSIDIVNQLLQTRYIEKYLDILASCDAETKRHSVRVAKIATDVGIELELPIKAIKTLCLAGLLHDIGKCEINKELLNQRGRLTKTNKKAIRKHASLGACKIKEDNLKVVSEIVRRHHDFQIQNTRCYRRIKRRKGSIPHLTEIIAAADIFDALQSRRPYKLPYGKKRIQRIMMAQFLGSKILISSVLKRY